MRRLVGIALAASLLAAAPSSAHHAGETFQAGSLVVSHVWAHENPPSSHANAVYLTVVNDGLEADRLMGVEGDFFHSAEFQAPVVDEDAQDRFGNRDRLGQSLPFQPGGFRFYWWVCRPAFRRRPLSPVPAL